MLDKFIVKEVVESNELHKQIPLYWSGGAGKQVEVRYWQYDITDTQDRLWRLSYLLKPIPCKELRRNQVLYGYFGLNLHPEEESGYTGTIKRRLTKKEFDEKIEKHIASAKAIMADNLKEVERLISLK